MHPTTFPTPHLATTPSTTSTTEATDPTEAPGSTASFRHRRRFPSVGGKIVVRDVELARLARVARRERQLAEAAVLAERSAAAA